MAGPFVLHPVIASPKKRKIGVRVLSLVAILNPFNMRPVYFSLVFLSSALVSCVSTGKFKAMQQEAQKNDSLYEWSQHTLKTCQDTNTGLNKQKSSLQDQMNSLNLELTASKENNMQLRKQLRDLSALSSSQAESIRKSMDNMGARDIYIQDLQSAIKHRDSVNLAVVMNLKAFLGGFSEQGLNIKVEKGVVYVDISDTLLFNGDTTGFTMNDKAKAILGRPSGLPSPNTSQNFSP